MEASGRVYLQLPKHNSAATSKITSKFCQDGWCMKMDIHQEA